jgi:hypothetical protein
VLRSSQTWSCSSATTTRGSRRRGSGRPASPTTLERLSIEHGEHGAGRATNSSSPSSSQTIGRLHGRPFVCLPGRRTMPSASFGSYAGSDSELSGGDALICGRGDAEARVPRSRCTRRVGVGGMLVCGGFGNTQANWSSGHHCLNEGLDAEGLAEYGRTLHRVPATGRSGLLSRARAGWVVGLDAFRPDRPRPERDSRDWLDNSQREACPRSRRRRHSVSADSRRPAKTPNDAAVLSRRRAARITTALAYHDVRRRWEATQWRRPRNGLGTPPASSGLPSTWKERRR